MNVLDQLVLQIRVMKRVRISLTPKQEAKEMVWDKLSGVALDKLGAR